MIHMLQQEHLVFPKNYQNFERFWQVFKQLDHFFCVYIASSKHKEGWENVNFETVMQTLDLGLHNFPKFSQPPPF